MSTPQYTYTMVNGVEVVTYEAWRLDSGLYHRIDEPAMRAWQVVDGEVVLTLEAWYLNGQLHRTDRPACRVWEIVDGYVVLAEEEWCLNGLRHRTDGLALREREVVDGRTVLTEEWYLKGNLIHPRILRQPVRAIERWWQFQQRRRQEAIEEELWESGMTVFPGFMGLLREY